MATRRVTRGASATKPARRVGRGGRPGPSDNTDFDEMDAEEEDLEEEEEEPEKPLARKRHRAAERNGSDDDDEEVGDDGEIEGGWAAFDEGRKNAPKGGGFLDREKKLKVTQEEVLLHAIDEGPFATLWEHWIDELSGKKSWICRNQKRLKSDEHDCGLCHAGDTPSQKTYFNFASLADPDNPEVLWYQASPTVVEMLKKIATNPKYKPINKLDVYLECQMVGGRHQFHPIKASRLEEDWEVEPLTADELADLEEERFDKSAFKKPSAARLREVAQEISE
jgi:hypothetical protein